MLVTSVGPTAAQVASTAASKGLSSFSGGARMGSNSLAAFQGYSTGGRGFGAGQPVNTANPLARNMRRSMTPPQTAAGIRSRPPTNARIPSRRLGTTRVSTSFNHLLAARAKGNTAFTGAQIGGYMDFQQQQKNSALLRTQPPRTRSPGLNNSYNPFALATGAGGLGNAKKLGGRSALGRKPLTSARSGLRSADRGISRKALATNRSALMHR